MKYIDSKKDWLAMTMADMLTGDLCNLLEEITDFADTGLLAPHAKLREIERKYSEQVTHTRSGEMMRTVEYAALYEMARRYSNSTALKERQKLPHMTIMDDHLCKWLKEKYPTVEGVVATHDERTPYIIEGMSEADANRLIMAYAPTKEVNNFYENGKCYCTTATLGNFVADISGYVIEKDEGKVRLTTTLDDTRCFVLYEQD